MPEETQQRDDGGSAKVRLLFWGDSEGLVSLERALEQVPRKAEVEQISGAAELSVALTGPAFDAIVVDVALGGIPAVVGALGGRTVPIIALLANWTEEGAAALMSLGAEDCLPRCNLARVGAVLERSAGRRGLASSQSYLDLLESLVDVHYRSTLDGQLVEIGPSIRDAGGYQPGEMRGKDVRPFYADAKQREAVIAELTRRGAVDSFLLKMRVRDGSLRDVLLSARLVRTGEGEPVFIEGVLRDVTEGHQAQRALRESEARYRSLVENATDPIFIVDREGRFRFANGVAGRYFNVPPAKLVGSRMWDWFPQPVADTQFGDILTVIDSGVGQVFERRSVIGGEEHWFHANIQPVYEEGGKVQSAQVMARDITATKRAEAAFRLERDLARSFLDVAGVLIVMLRTDETVALINKAGCELLGYQEEEIRDQNWFDLVVSPVRREATRQQFHARLADPAGVTSVLETTLVGRDGREHAFIWHGTILEAEGGQTFGVVMSGTDITERQQAEEALRRTEKLYRTLAERFPNGSVFLFDRELRFTLAEGEGLRTVGPPREEIIGRRVDEAFGLEEVRVLLPAYRAALAGQASSFEASFADHVYQVHVLPVHGTSGAVELGMVMTQDITERKQAEVERERLITELREALASVRTLTGLLPICASCKKIRDDQGYWRQVDDYLRAHVDVSISHGLCHDCAVELYPEMFEGSATEGENP